MIVFGGFPAPATVPEPWPEGFLTVEEAAQRLGISTQRVRVLLAQGKLPGFLHDRGFRKVWCIHKALHRRPGVAGRPKTKRRKAAAGDGGSEAKP